ncbi:MAG: hypothetical protein EHM20_17915, partial [Alphaproteobacteria bacterium]
MENIITTLQPVDNLLKPVNKFYLTTVLPIVEEPHIATILTLIVSLNIIYLADKVPENIKCVITHPITQAIVFFVSTYGVYGSIVHALVATAVLLAVSMTLQGGTKKILEKFRIITPGTDIFPGCVDIKMND